jgi:hypothetical protein
MVAITRRTTLQGRKLKSKATFDSIFASASFKRLDPGGFKVCLIGQPALPYHVAQVRLPAVQRRQPGAYTRPPFSST